MSRRDFCQISIMGWALLSLPIPLFAQTVDGAMSRNLNIPGTSGERSFSLQIRAEGRSGIVIVKTEEGSKRQTFTCPLLRDNPEPSPAELAAAREQFVSHFVVADLDFDHHPDLAGVREFGAKWARYCVWLYDPKQHLFTKDFLAEQMELLDNLQSHDGQISASYPGPTNPWVAFYRIVQNQASRPVRQLVPVSSCLFESRDLESERPNAVLITNYRDSQPVVHRYNYATLVRKTAALPGCPDVKF